MDFETIAILSMSFIGFSAIVILLRQSDGRKLSAWDAFIAHVYMENGLIAIVGALLPPLFEFWQLSPTAAFRLASGFMALVFSAAQRFRRGVTLLPANPRPFTSA